MQKHVGHKNLSIYRLLQWSHRGLVHKCEHLQDKASVMGRVCKSRRSSNWDQLGQIAVILVGTPWGIHKVITSCSI